MLVEILVNDPPTGLPEWVYGVFYRVVQHLAEDPDNGVKNLNKFLRSIRYEYDIPKDLISRNAEYNIRIRLESFKLLGQVNNPNPKPCPWMRGPRGRNKSHKLDDSLKLIDQSLRLTSRRQHFSLRTGGTSGPFGHSLIVISCKFCGRDTPHKGALCIYCNKSDTKNIPKITKKRNIARQFSRYAINIREDKKEFYKRRAEEFRRQLGIADQSTTPALPEHCEDKEHKHE